MEPPDAPAGRAAPGGGVRQYLTFRLATEDYGVEILKVQEIRAYTSVTPLPNCPPWIKGVMNLRGAVIPVLDLRSKFGLPELADHRFSVVIVVRAGTKVWGVLADGVSDVQEIADADVDSPPDVGAPDPQRFVTGVARAASAVTILLDVDRLVRHDAAAAATA